MDAISLAMPVAKPAKRPNNLRFSRHWAGVTFNGVNAALPGALFNDFDPKYIHKKEKPEHRRMLTLKEQGYTNREIAAAVGYSETSVSNMLRQPYARQHIIETMQKDVSNEIKEFLEKAVMPALSVIKEIAHNELARPSDRLAAATALLDRHLGKPNQPFTSTPLNAKSVSEMSVAELDAALAATGFVAGGKETSPEQKQS